MASLSDETLHLFLLKLYLSIVLEAGRESLLPFVILHRKRMNGLFDGSYEILCFPGTFNGGLPLLKTISHSDLEELHALNLWFVNSIRLINICHKHIKYDFHKYRCDLNV